MRLLALLVLAISLANPCLIHAATERHLLVAGDHQLTVLDAATGDEITVIPIGDPDYSGPCGVAVAENKAYVVRCGGGEVFVIDLTTNEIRSTIGIACCGGRGEVTICPGDVSDGGYAYTTVRPDADFSSLSHMPTALSVHSAAHELGHTFNVDHSDCFQPTPITTCPSTCIFTPCSDQSCCSSNPRAPADLILSYCSLYCPTDYTQMYFHPLEAAHMRNYVADRTCGVTSVGPDCREGMDSDGDGLSPFANN